MIGYRIALAGAVLGVVGFAVAFSARAAEPAFVNVSAGVAGVFDTRKSGDFRMEYRGSESDKVWMLTPILGFMATTRAATYGYVGLGLDTYFGRRWVVTPNLAAGLYGDGDGPDLGHLVQLRSGLEIAYRYDNRARLGLAFHHISNAGLNSSKNPGTQTLVLSYSLPIDSLFGK